MNTQISPVLSAYELRRKQNEVVDKFFNRMQRQAMAINAHDEYIVASRGTGKSEGIDARIILRNVWEMPGSLGGLISPSYAKAWGNTLPAICKALAKQIWEFNFLIRLPNANIVLWCGVLWNRMKERLSVILPVIRETGCKWR